MRRGRAPLAVSWIVTNRCNLRCEYCACPDVKVPELGTEQALDAVDGMARLGAVNVHITGGEPLTRKDLPAIVQRLRYHGVRVSLTTNGTLVPRRIRMLESCVAVSLSLDGPPEVHDRNRADGQVEEVLAACRALRERFVPIRLLCLITRRTTPEAIDFVLDVAERFDGRVSFQPALDTILASSDPNPLTAPAAHVRAMLTFVEARRAAGRPVGSTQGALRHLMRWPEKAPLHCPVNRVAVRISPEGVLLPCHERTDLASGESILDGGFEAAFARLRLAPCVECWGSSRVELREALRAGPRSIGRLVGRTLRPPRRPEFVAWEAAGEDSD